MGERDIKFIIESNCTLNYRSHIVQLWKDWDRQVRYKNENKTREELTKLNKETGEINSVKFNAKKRN